MTPIIGETIYLDFITSASTGAAADADSTPTFEVFEDATDTALTLSGTTLAKRTSKTGNYRITIPVTSGNGFESGKSYNVVASATVGGVAAKAVVSRFQARTQTADNLPTLAQILAGGDVDGYTVEETLKTILSVLAGKSSGMGTTTGVLRAADDSKARVTATLDADGNRTAVTIDATG